MSKRSNLFFLSLVLVIDILFFVVLGSMYPHLFEALLDWLPFSNDVETAVILISGLVIAIVTSLVIVQILISGLKEVLG